MSELDYQIKEHESRIKELTHKLEKVSTNEDKLNYNILINQQKDFIISLYKIKNSNNFENEKKEEEEKRSNKNVKPKKIKHNKKSNSVDLNGKKQSNKNLNTKIRIKSQNKKLINIYMK